MTSCRCCMSEATQLAMFEDLGPRYIRLCGQHFDEFKEMWLSGGDWNTFLHRFDQLYENQWMIVPNNPWR